MLINIKYSTRPQKVTERICQVAECFGIGIDENIEHVILDNYEFDESANVVYITGDSGGGKSSLLKELKKYYEVEDFDFDTNSDTAIIDLVGDSFSEALNILSKVGLGEARLFIKPYKYLSDGQKYRFQLGMMLYKKQKVLCIDEFTSFLDRTNASVVAYNMQKVCRRNGIKLIVATAHSDLEEFLNPDMIIDFGSDEDEVVTRHREVDISYNPFKKDLKIEDGTKEDFYKLIKYHYKGHKYVPGTKAIYKLTYKDKLVGIVTYGGASRMLNGRNTYFNKFYMTERGYAKMTEVNKDFVAATRCVISPAFRAIGLGSYLMENTACKFDVPFVEAIAVMSNYNKFIQKGKFLDVGINESKKTADSKQRIIELLDKYGYSYDFLGSQEYCQEIINNIPHDEIMKAFYPSIRSGLYIRKGLDLDKKEIFELELDASLLQMCKIGITRYMLYPNPNKTVQCPKCGHYHSIEYGCHFCDKEE